MPTLKGMAKAIYSGGRFVAVTDQGAVFELDNAPTLERAQKFKADVEAALAAHLGTPVNLVLVDATDPDARAMLAGATSTAPAPTPARSPEPDPVAPPEPARTARSEPERAAPPSARPGQVAPTTSAPETPGRPRGGDTTSDGPAGADDTSADDTADDDESTIIDVHELEDADVAATGVEKLTKAFPGAVLVDGAEGTA